MTYLLFSACKPFVNSEEQVMIQLTHKHQDAWSGSDYLSYWSQISPLITFVRVKGWLVQNVLKKDTAIKRGSVWQQLLL